ncbi:XRE family transcriptional regulator [Actinomadura craniellae]|uniref:XRE family transcriptional regulator n=1 Tax=Actinomadura craniellae TaxID=2231787 RepID=A0A365GYU1_9ACTN|nr:XRE family transcriptional regulator [Actinomadura craniellae]
MAIATEIHDQCAPLFGTSRVRAHRLARGIALSDVVAQVRALYEAEGKPPPKLGETLLSAYESGHKRPGSEYLHYLCRVYRTEPDDLGYPGPCLCGSDHGTGTGVVPRRPAGEPGTLVGSVVAAVPDDRPWRATGAEPPATADADEEETVLRGVLLRLLAGAGVVPDGRFLGAVDGVRRRMDDALVSSTVTATMLDQWAETALDQGRRYQATPPVRLLCDVLLDLAEVRRMCERRQPLENQERLCRIAAQLAGLAGFIMTNLGDHRLARSFFRTARTAADETGDRALRAWVTVRESLVPLYYGDPPEALILARKAQDLAGRAPGVAAAMAPAVEARALGMLALQGRSDTVPAARRALVRARAVFDRLPQPCTTDLAFGFTERQLAFYEGDTFTALGDHRRGEEALSRALTLYAATDRVDRTLVRLGRAACRLHAGDPDAALSAAREAIIELPVEHRSDILLHRARLLGVAVRDRHGEIPELAEFTEAISPAGRRRTASGDSGAA